MPKILLKTNQALTSFSVVDAVKRKINIAGTTILTQHYYDAAVQYYSSLKDHPFRAIVFDYDLTIHNKHTHTTTEERIFSILNNLLSKGIIIGIATGNGEYIAGEIRDKVHPQYWSNIIMGYYNGGFIISLDSNTVFSDLQEEIPFDFQKIKDFLFTSIPKGKVCADGIEDNNPFQLNFFSDEKGGLTYVEQIKDFILHHTDLKILQTPHSFDVVPKWVSKTNVCNRICDKGIKPDEILTVGDTGQFGGNDYELLNRKFGLSVNKVSSSIYNCWNFAPESYQNLEATLYYLELLSFRGNGTISFDI